MPVINSPVDEQHRRLDALQKQGKTSQEVAPQIGRSPAAVGGDRNGGAGLYAEEAVVEVTTVAPADMGDDPQPPGLVEHAHGSVGPDRLDSVLRRHASADREVWRRQAPCTFEAGNESLRLEDLGTQLPVSDVEVQERAGQIPGLPAPVVSRGVRRQTVKAWRSD